MGLRLVEQEQGPVLYVKAGERSKPYKRLLPARQPVASPIDKPGWLPVRVDCCHVTKKLLLRPGAQVRYRNSLRVFFSARKPQFFEALDLRQRVQKKAEARIILYSFPCPCELDYQV